MWFNAASNHGLLFGCRTLRQRKDEVISMPNDHSVELRTRCDPALHQKIRAAAEDSVRSMSAEIAFRLQRSFEGDETLRGTLRS